MNLSDIASLLSLPVVPPLPVSAFSIDSRTIKPGEVFIALKGDNFDGHQYIAEVARKGALAIICEVAQPAVDIPQLVVPDTLKALADLATAHRQYMQGPVIALTGSNGKTTVKDMIAHILPKPSHATAGNFNNHIGAPLSVLRLNPTHQYAVFELGANHPGDITYTVSMVQPTVALINNIAPAHVEGFGSIEGVAKAKGEIYQGLRAGGTAIINADDAFAHYWDDLLKDKRVLRFSAKQVCDIYAKDMQENATGCLHFTLVLPDNSLSIQLQVPGKHQVSNALAAASCCLAAGISVTDIKKGLETFAGVAGRMTRLAGKNKSVIIDDTYNANLHSVLTALHVLAKSPGNKIFIFGDMGELGAFTTEHHQEVGVMAQKLGIDQLITCGKYSQFAAESFGKSARHYQNQAGLADAVLPLLDANTTVLVKGSRSSAMEKIVGQLLG